MKKIKPTKQKELPEKKSRDLGTNTYKATEQEQLYAVKRMFSIAEGHHKDKFSNPILCQAIYESYEFLRKMLMKYAEEKKVSLKTIDILESTTKKFEVALKNLAEK